MHDTQFRMHSRIGEKYLELLNKKVVSYASFQYPHTPRPQPQTRPQCQDASSPKPHSCCPSQATEATPHILSHTARPSINLPHRPPIHTLPNHLRIQRLRAVSPVGTSLKLPSSVANSQKDCFRFRRLGTHRLCLVSVSRMRLYRTPRIPSALPTPASAPPPSPPPRGERRGKGIDHFHPRYVSFRVMLLVFLQKDIRFWTGVLSFFFAVR